jgi:anti-sigma B factor antagonist
MGQSATSMTTRRVSSKVSVIDIGGSVTAASENALMDAYAEADESNVKVIVLNFAAIEYLNSTGIGLLVTLLVRANRQQQRLFAIGLSDHYQRIFELTRLNEAITLYDSEQQALAAADRL